jgi:hypothetical protein
VELVVLVWVGLGWLGLVWVWVLVGLAWFGWSVGQLEPVTACFEVTSLHFPGSVRASSIISSLLPKIHTCDLQNTTLFLSRACHEL